VANALALLTALPLIINNLKAFIKNTEKQQDQMRYFEEFIAKVLPAVLYLATKTNEDCFNCFNRLAP